ncbi:MAG TPA: hypothetical protein VK735_13410, partial [Pseudonocardia sp.]
MQALDKPRCDHHSAYFERALQVAREVGRAGDKGTVDVSHGSYPGEPHGEGEITSQDVEDLGDSG